MTWGLRIIDKGILDFKVPHEPGEYSFVAKVFMHIPLRYLRR